MKIIYSALLLLTLQACNYDNALLLCEENDAIDLLSLTDSTGLSLKATYNKEGGAWDNINGYHYIVGTNFLSGWFVPNSWSDEQEKQKFRVYKNNKPFSGEAKVCAPFKLKSGDGDIVVIETMNFENGYLDGKYIAYNYGKEEMRAYTRDRLLECNFRKGYKHGLWQRFETSFNSKEEGNYNMGVKVGYWDDVYGKGEYISGKKEGNWVDGLSSGKYLKNEKDGLWIRKDNEGNILERTTYENGNEINCEGDCD
jgi:hypothetical protein